MSPVNLKLYCNPDYSFLQCSVPVGTILLISNYKVKTRFGRLRQPTLKTHNLDLFNIEISLNHENPQYKVKVIPHEDPSWQLPVLSYDFRTRAEIRSQYSVHRIQLHTYSQIHKQPVNPWMNWFLHFLQLSASWFHMWHCGYINPHGKTRENTAKLVSLFSFYQTSAVSLQKLHPIHVIVPSLCSLWWLWILAEKMASSVGWKQPNATDCRIVYYLPGVGCDMCAVLFSWDYPFTLHVRDCLCGLHPACNCLNLQDICRLLLILTRISWCMPQADVHANLRPGRFVILTQMKLVWSVFGSWNSRQQRHLHLTTTSHSQVLPPCSYGTCLSSWAAGSQSPKLCLLYLSSWWCIILRIWRGRMPPTLWLLQHCVGVNLLQDGRCSGMISPWEDMIRIHLCHSIWRNTNPGSQMTLLSVWVKSMEFAQCTSCLRSKIPWPLPLVLLGEFADLWPSCSGDP